MIQGIEDQHQKSDTTSSQEECKNRKVLLNDMKQGALIERKV